MTGLVPAVVSSARQGIEGGRHMHAIEVEITAVDQHGMSRNGNSSYRVTVVGGSVFTTDSDAAVISGITNSDYRGVPVVLTLTDNSRIIGIRCANGDYPIGTQAEVK